MRSQAGSQSNGAEAPISSNTTQKKLSSRLPFKWVRNQRSSSRTQNGSTVASPLHEDSAEIPTAAPLGSLGLQLIYEPRDPPPVDIIFVHGLGGHSRNTWSFDHKPENFWPGLWLPNDSVIGTARIFTFGYDARILGPKKMTTILAFAKVLLSDMHTITNINGQSLNLGRVPIILVAHSMGGLVAKEAYLSAQNNTIYQDLFLSIQAMVFLGTPHKGADLALDLDRILRYALGSEKNSIRDIQKNSSILEKLNDQFCLLANKLSIISFYEELDTGITKRLSFRIVPRESAVLGYENEESRLLVADHHNICKFAHQQDTNYVAVRNALRGLVNKYGHEHVEQLRRKTTAAAAAIRKVLCVNEDPAMMRFFFDHRRMQGSCQWILAEPNYQTWLVDKQAHVLWYHGPPGRGKSVIASYVIKRLLESGHDCLYHFFTFGDQSKRSLSHMVRSITYQAACAVSEVLDSLSSSSFGSQEFENCGFLYLWNKLFKPNVLQRTSSRPMFLVLDAVDEAENPKAVIELLMDLTQSSTLIKVFFTSRRTGNILSACQRPHPGIRLGIIDGDTAVKNGADIEAYVDSEFRGMSAKGSTHEILRKEVLERARGNFLWVTLVVEDLINCQTEEELFEVLNSVPGSMSNFYRSMETSILAKASKANIALTRTLLHWVMISPRPLTVQELANIAAASHGTILDIKRTLRYYCGQFLVIDETDHVLMVHQTAREYFMSKSAQELAIQADTLHEDILTKYLCGLREPILGPDTEQTIDEIKQRFPFHMQAAELWYYHLSSLNRLSYKTLDALGSFFRKDYVLRWIHLLALDGKLQIMVRSATALSEFVASQRGLNMSPELIADRHVLLDLLDGWAIDLARIAAKFSSQILTQPTWIYSLIPMFCPTESTVHRQFGSGLHRALQVMGNSRSWSDVALRVSIPQGESILKLNSAGLYITALTYHGVIHVWSSIDFRQVCSINHLERVTQICMNTQGTILVTYGEEMTKLWSIPSGQTILSVPNPKISRAMSLCFIDRDTRVLAVLNDRFIWSLSIEGQSEGWTMLNEIVLAEGVQSESRFINTPSCVEIDASGTLVAISYRSFPLTVWSLKSGRVIGRCRRMAGSNTLHHDRPAWFPVDFFTWNATSGHLIGTYKDGTIFKWHPFSGECQEKFAAVDMISSSVDGRFFLTSDTDGTVKVWNFALFTEVYQLPAGDLVAGLSFGPTGMRFYDARGSTITVWEPNTLLRLRGEADESSGAILRPLTPQQRLSEAGLSQQSELTVVAVSSSGALCLTGYDDGDVKLFNVDTRVKTSAMKFNNFMSIRHIVSSSDGHIVAAADLASEVQILQVTQNATNRKQSASCTTLSKPRLRLNERPIHQMVLRQSPPELLLLSHDIARIWSISNDELRVEVAIDESNEKRQWIVHPKKAEFLLAVGPHDILCYTWLNLQMVHRFEIPGTAFDMGKEPTIQMVETRTMSSDIIEAVHKCFLAQDSEHLICYTKQSTSDGRKQNRFLMFSVNELSNLEGVTLSNCISPRDLTEDLAGEAELVLGLLPGSLVVFLDRDLWVCTTKLDNCHSPRDWKRHYFLPRDWASLEMLDQCILLMDGTVLCPRDDDVVTIRSEFLSDKLPTDDRWCF